MYLQTKLQVQKNASQTNFDKNFIKKHNQTQKQAS